MKHLTSRKLILPLAIAASLSVSPLALAWSGGGNGGPGDGYGYGKPSQRDCQRGMQNRMNGGAGGKMSQHRFEHMAVRLGLSEDQRDAMRDIFADKREQRLERRQQKQGQNRPQLFSGDPTSSDYQARIEEAANRAAEMARQRVQSRADHYAAIHEVLNEEQREIWAKMQTERQAMKAERQGRMEQRRSGGNRN